MIEDKKLCYRYLDCDPAIMCQEERCMAWGVVKVDVEGQADEVWLNTCKLIEKK